MDIKVVFNFNQYIETKQGEIRMYLPLHEIPQKGNNVGFNYEIAEDLAKMTLVVADVQYTYFKGGLDCIMVYLRNAEDAKQLENTYSLSKSA